MTTAVLLFAALAAAALLAAADSPAAEGGPPCTDITSGSSNFPSSTTGTYTLRFQLTLAARACIGKITYKLFVETDSGTSEATHTGFSPEGYPQFEFSSTDSTICVYGTTSNKTGRIYDRAPNADDSPNCVALVAGGTGGNVGMG